MTATIKNRRENFCKKAVFLFSLIFKPYKRFLFFYEDYHSELKKAALIEYL
jgi:hypothetical protein